MRVALRSHFLRLRSLYRSCGRWLYEHISPTGRAFANVWPQIDSIKGLLVPGQENWLFGAARRLPDRAVIVEIGSYVGRSTCCLAYGCVGTRKHVYAIDTFNGNDADFFERDFFGEFTNNIERCSLAEYVTPLIGTSGEVAGNWDRPVSLLFIDGSHVYEDVLADFRSFFPWVVPDGIVALHDVGDGRGHPGPFRAWHQHIKSQLRDLGTCGTLAFGTKPRQ